MFLFVLSLCFCLVNSRNCVCRAKNDILINEIPEVIETPEVTGNGKNFIVLNSCSFDISIGMTGSDNGPSDGECPKYQEYNENGRCFWSLDTPDTLKSGEDYLIELNSDNDHIVSGNIWGTKPELMKESCPEGGCPSWVGPIGSITKAEFTISRDKTDYIDVSIIEGANIPMKMYANDASVDSEDRYDCGVAGTGSWDFQPGKELQKYVTIVTSETEETCDITSDCSESLVCGASFKNRPPVYGLCGKFNGYASAHMNCIAGSTGPPFFCESEKNVISCQEDYSLSGYNSPVGTTVCGCPDWEKDFSIDAPPVAPCVTSDKRWEEKSLPFLVFLKKKCPLCYVFAYDDMASTVTCGRAKSYTIEFCPDETEKAFF